MRVSTPRPKDDIEHSIAEVEMGQVDLNTPKALKLKQQQTKRTNLLFLRMVATKKIARIKSSKQFKMDIPPPDGFNRKLTTARRRL